MSTVGEIERITQNRIVKLFKNSLGYNYLGNWEERLNNSNIEEDLLKDYLVNTAKYSEALANKAIYELGKEARNYDRNLYQNNKQVYQLLRYGKEVKTNPSDRYQRVHFINWEHPETNHFAFAEEVTIRNKREKRMELILSMKM